MKLDPKSALARVLKPRLTKYIFVGAWNTFFGYSIGIFLYYSLKNYMHIIVIATIGNIVAITMSFVTYKMFVFNTTGNWLVECFRSYIVYGSSAVLGVILLWILVDIFTVPYCLAQATIILVTIIVSYISHNKYTFSRKV